MPACLGGFPVAWFKNRDIPEGGSSDLLVACLRQAVLCVSSNRRADIKAASLPCPPPVASTGSPWQGLIRGCRAGGQGGGRRVAAALAAPLITSRPVPGPAASRPAKGLALLI